MDNDNFFHQLPDPCGTHSYIELSNRSSFELFASRQNVLVKPENGKIPRTSSAGRVQFARRGASSFGFRDHFYGQCWTLQSGVRCDVAKYSPNSEAVRVRSTVRKLAEAFGNAAVKAPHEAFIR